MSAQQPLRGKRILVLEDDYYIATDEKLLLEQAGANVAGPFGRTCTASDIESAGQVDAAVVDINLGSGPAFDFARLLTERGTPFVFVTGYSAAAIPEEMRDVPRLEKPLREGELIALLSRMVSE